MPERVPVVHKENPNSQKYKFACRMPVEESEQWSSPEWGMVTCPRCLRKRAG
jgi:hypothetical protein